MRLQLRLASLAAVTTLAAGATPAYAFDITALPRTDARATQVQQANSRSSIDWIIAAGSAGAVTLLTSGLVMTHRRGAHAIASALGAQTTDPR